MLILLKNIQNAISQLNAHAIKTGTYQISIFKIIFGQIYIIKSSSVSKIWEITELTIFWYSTI